MQSRRRLPINARIPLGGRPSETRVDKGLQGTCPETPCLQGLQSIHLGEALNTRASGQAH